MLTSTEYYQLRVGKTSWVAGILIILSFTFSLKASSLEKDPLLEASVFMPAIYGLHSSALGCLPSPSIPPDNLIIETETIAGLNNARLAYGRDMLTTVYELTQSSRRHSHDMANNGFTSHTGSDGTKAGQRIKEACYNWSSVGEIIGWGFAGSTQKMIRWWLNSSPHKAAILSKNFVDIGAGYADNPDSTYRHYWTVNFGRRSTNAEDKQIGSPSCTFSDYGSEGGSMLIVYDEEFCKILLSGKCRL